MKIDEKQAFVDLSNAFVVGNRSSAQYGELIKHYGKPTAMTKPCLKEVSRAKRDGDYYKLMWGTDLDDTDIQDVEHRYPALTAWCEVNQKLVM